MSAVSELAQREALIAEAELTDEETERLHELMQAGGPLQETVELIVAEREPEPEPEPAPQPTEPPSGEPTDKQFRALARESDRHAAKVREIMGPFAEGMVECERCSGMGLAPAGPEPQTHAFFKQCDTCAGFGLVLTGSARQGHESRDCPECRGRGYLEALSESGAPLAEAGPQASAPGPSLAPTIIVPPAEPERNGHAEPRFGVPSWMGDPGIGG